VFEPTWSPWPLVNLPWLAYWLLVGLAIVTLTANLWLAHRQPMAAVMATIIWGILFAPLGEQYHHTVILIPLTWLLFGWLNLPKFGRMMVATAVMLYLLPLPIVNDGSILLAYPRLYGAWLLLAAVYMTPQYSGQRSTGKDC
jgi:hypothetical protein